MTRLPSGTVTFLFTDIEGSTQLWERHRERMAAALARHDALLRESIEAHGGHVFKTVGDAFYAAFETAPEALATAVAAQRALVAESWHIPGGLRARMALHTGIAEQRNGDYFGPALNRVARLLGAGHGGQILLSHPVRELTLDQLPDGAELRDFGECRLKDLARPEHIFQLVVPGLPAEFPPLRTLDTRPNNLPAGDLPLVGRERELDSAVELLLQPEVRLLTLTGHAARDRSRLALHVAAALIDSFAEGVFYVPLGSLGNPGLLPFTMAQTLGLRETGGRAPLETLKDSLAPKRLLLVLDGFDAVRPAAALLGELLEAAPQLKLLVVSRRPVGLPAEHELHVPPLPRTTRRRLLLSATMTLILVLSAAGVLLYRSRAPALTREQLLASNADPGIAVLPFSVRGAGLGDWREGMVDLLSTNLDGVAGLRAIDSRTVLARWRESVQDGARAPDLNSTLAIARRTGARYALLGSVAAAGRDMRLTAEVYELESSHALGQGQVAGSTDSIFQLVDRLSIEVLQSILQGKDTRLPKVNLARATTASLPALKAYLKGEIAFRQSRFQSAVAAYQQALESDSTFALAYYRLGISYGWFTYQSGLELENLQRAARNLDRLPARDAQLVRGALAYLGQSPEAFGLLRDAVRRFPDDLEAWYLLAESYQHIGHVLLIERDQAVRAFSRCLELDPSFAPGYIHLIEKAFHDADSGRAAALIETYGRFSEGSDHERWARQAFAVAFGDSATRAAAEAALADRPILDLLGIGFILNQSPWYALEMERVLQSQPPPQDDEGQVMVWLLLYAYLEQGKLQKVLETPRAPERYRAAALYDMHALGVSFPGDSLERLLSVEGQKDPPDLKLLAAGAYAADQGRWSDHAETVTILADMRRESLAEGDSSQAMYLAALAKALDGYAVWKRGKPAEALLVLQAAQRKAISPSYEGNATIRLWIGKLLLELNRAADAQPYLNSFWGMHLEPLANYYLGQAYDQLEQHEAARRAYALFATVWRDADPELQPMVEEARRAAARTRSVIRE